MLWSSILVALLTCGLASHAQFYAPSYCYNVSLLANQYGGDAMCVRTDAYAVMTKIYYRGLNLVDGGGGVGAAKVAECCFIESGTVPSGTAVTPSVSANFAGWAQEITCAQGLYLHRIVMKSNVTDKTDVWTTLYCYKPPNFQTNTYNGAKVYVPFRAALYTPFSDPGYVGCPSGAYLIGFKTASSDANNIYYGDLADIESLICAYPFNSVCPLTAFQENLTAVATLDSRCNASVHQWCVATLSCSSGYYQARASSSVTLWNPPLARYTMSSFAETNSRRDPRLVSYNYLLRPTKEQLANYYWYQNWSWSPNAEYGYLIIDLGAPRVITGIITLGGCGDPLWRYYDYVYVSSYMYSFANYTANFSTAATTLVAGNTDGYTPKINNVSAVARYVKINISSYNAHSYLRADVYVQPDDFFMIKDASFGLNCSSSNLGSHLAALMNACKGQKYSCSFYVNGTGMNGSCALSTQVFIVEWFYNGDLQPVQMTKNAHGRTITLVPLAPKLTCQPGGTWTGTLIRCANMNECQRKCNATEIPGISECHNCDDNTSVCVDQEGGFNCDCRPGYKPNGTVGVCVNVDECASICGEGETPFVNKCHNCDVISTDCLDTVGNFSCVCKSGFTPMSPTACNPINECIVPCTNVTTAHCNACFNTSSCVDTNTSMGFDCTCPSGYTGNGTVCTDINECADVASCPQYSSCTNTNGSFVCNCLSGFQNQGGVCVDVNECTNTSICGGACVNVLGSYRCPPYISAVRWLFAGNATWSAVTNNTAAATLTSVSQTSYDIVEITLDNLLNTNFSVKPVQFAFGSPLYPLDFFTSYCTVVLNVFTCNMTTGAGSNLRFSLSYGYLDTDYTYWQTPLFPFSFPVPTLTNGTLRTVGSSGTTNLVLSTQFGGDVLLDGTNFYSVTAGPSPQFSVSFGPTPVFCALQQSNATTLQCHASSFVGVNLTFQIKMGRGGSEQVVYGSDTISAILFSNNASCSALPSIINISGCVTGSSSISQCPTQGGGTITITTNIALLLPVVAWVGGRPCLFVSLSSNNATVTCTLPAGVGKNVAVTVGHSSPAMVSVASYLVSYASPTVTSISSPSCTSLDNATLVDCVSSGFLYITGSNFGSSGATVLAGGVYIPAIHDPTISVHQNIYIPFPAFQSGVLQLLVFAKSGAGTVPGVGSPSYSFVKCLPGEMTNVTGYCTACSPGFFTNSSGRRWCTPCNPGFFQPNSGKSSCQLCPTGSFTPMTNSSQCLPCTAGTFSQLGASTCTNCAPGSYSFMGGAGQCLPCAPGMYQPLPGMNACTKCTPGYFANATSQTACQACAPGTRSVIDAASACELCQAGRFQTNPGSSQCVVCGPATYTNAPGAVQCLQCPPGSYSSASEATSCVLCSAGYAQDQCGMQNCDACGPGSYAATPGQVRCAPCQPGRATNLTQQVDCQDCEAGEYQSNAGQAVCEDCPAGQFSVLGQTLVCQKCKAGKTASAGSGCTDCDVGTFRESEDSATACANCATGYYQTAKGQARCKECPAGWFSNSTSNCQQCSQGTYSTGTASTCIECAAGYYARPFEGESQCFACQPGRFSNETAATSCTKCAAGTILELAGGKSCSPCDAGKFSSTLSTSCDKCAAGRYSAGASLDDCLSCPNGATVNKEQTRCLCMAGQYGITTVVGGITNFECFNNPGGTETSLAGILKSDLVTLPGYWRKDNASLNYYRCYAPQFCLGGKESTCGNFREGPMCALCKPGYKSAGTNRDCAACPAVVEASWGITAAILTAVGIVLIFAYWLILKMADVQQKELLEKHRAQQESTMSSLAEATTVGDEYFAQLRAEIQDKEIEEVEEPIKKPEKEEDIIYGQRRVPNFMYKIKIFVGFYQVASLLPSQGGIIWPRQFVDFINFFSFLNFDFVPWQNLACAVTMDYYTKILIVGLLPIAIISALALFFTASLFFYGRKDNLATQMTKQIQVMRAKRQFTKLVLFTIFLLYPFVSRTTLGVYNCVDIDGVQYLAADFTLLCGAPEWKVAAGYTAVFVALYPIGTPVIYYFLMSRVDRRSPEAFLELGFLYEAYVDGRWYWELLDMGHKLILTSIVVFMPNALIMGANMIIMILYLILLLVCNPYLRKGDDRLHLLAQTNLFVLALMGHALRLLDDPFKAPFGSRDTVEALLSTLLIAINVLFLASFLIIAGRNIKKAYENYVAKKKTKDLPEREGSVRPQVALVALG